MAKRNPDGLTDQQRRFVGEYLIDLNATQAAIRSGYSEKTATVQGSRLLANVKVSHAIEEAKSKRAERMDVTQDEVIEGLREIAGRCLQSRPVQYYSKKDKCMVQVQDEEGRNVWTFDSAGGNRAFELLGKHIGMFTDKVKHEFDELPDDERAEGVATLLDLARARKAGRAGSV